MNDKNSSRREFLRTSGAAVGGAWLGASLPAIVAAAEEAAARVAAGTSWVTLTTSEAAALAAMADQILPPDDTPGAAEMGAVQFMDVALGGMMAGQLHRVQAGIQDLDLRGRTVGFDGFTELKWSDQTIVLQSIQSTPFFAQVHAMTLMGVFAMSEHGGNTDQAGWKLIGFEPQHVWQPPFGYYDAQYAKGEDDAGA